MLRSIFDLKFEEAQSFELGTITFYCNSCKIYFTHNHSTVCLKASLDDGQSAFYFTMQYQIGVNWHGIFKTWFDYATIEALILHYHCILADYIRRDEFHYIQTECTKCVPKVCSMTNIWLLAKYPFLCKLFDQGLLAPDPFMKHHALPFGFWLPEWERLDGWPYATHKYLRDCGSESYLHILPDKQNLIRLIKRFL